METNLLRVNEEAVVGMKLPGTKPNLSVKKPHRAFPDRVGPETERKHWISQSLTPTLPQSGWAKHANHTTPTISSLTPGNDTVCQLTPTHAHTSEHVYTTTSTHPIHQPCHYSMTTHPMEHIHIPRRQWLRVQGDMDGECSERWYWDHFKGSRKLLAHGQMHGICKCSCRQLHGQVHGISKCPCQ